MFQLAHGRGVIGLECGLVLRAVGYRGSPIEGIPFEERRGLIPNEAGRVLGEDGRHRSGEYAVGWIKRGPSGVIWTNKKDAADTVARIVEDAKNGRLNEPTSDDPSEIEVWLRERVADLVTWEGWQSIDLHERQVSGSSVRSVDGRHGAQNCRFGEVSDGPGSCENRAG